MFYHLYKQANTNCQKDVNAKKNLSSKSKA